MTREIEVVPYDSNWPKVFEEESATIKQALGENCIAVHHIGSTAVPGLCAKPKIDIILIVKDTTDITHNLETLGYTYRGKFNIPFHLGFTKRDQVPEVNLHVYEEGNPEIDLNILFRDYLKTHPEAREEYGNLKLNLVKQDASHQKTNDRVSGFNLGKDVFIKKILKKRDLMVFVCGFAPIMMSGRLPVTFDKNTFLVKFQWLILTPGHSIIKIMSI